MEKKTRKRRRRWLGFLVKEYPDLPDEWYKEILREFEIYSRDEDRRNCFLTTKEGWRRVVKSVIEGTKFIEEQRERYGKFVLETLSKGIRCVNPDYPIRTDDY